MSQMFRKAQRALAGGLALIAALNLTAAAIAQPAPAKAAATSPALEASPEKLKAASLIVRIYLDSYRDDIIDQHGQLSVDNPLFKVPPYNNPVVAERLPDWIRDGRHSSLAALADYRPQLEPLLARALASHETLAELRAGEQFMIGLGGRYANRIFTHEYMQRNFAPLLKKTAAAKTEPDPKTKAMQDVLEKARAQIDAPLPADEAAALARLKASPEGRRFLDDTIAVGVWLKDDATDLVGIVMPPSLIHLSEDMEASEARRAAAAPAPAPAMALGVSAVHGLFAAIDDKTWDRFTAFTIDTADKAAASSKAKPVIPDQEHWVRVAIMSGFDLLRKDQVLLEQAIGRGLARLLPVEDLQALSDFTNGPVPAYYVGVAVAKLDGAKEVTPPSAEVSASLQKFGQSGISQHLTARYQQDKQQVAAIGMDMGMPILARWMRRLGEEIRAYEQTRTTAHS